MFSGSGFVNDSHLVGFEWLFTRTISFSSQRHAQPASTIRLFKQQKASSGFFGGWMHYSKLPPATSNQANPEWNYQKIRSVRNVTPANPRMHLLMLHHPYQHHAGLDGSTTPRYQLAEPPHLFCMFQLLPWKPTNETWTVANKFQLSVSNKNGRVTRGSSYNTTLVPLPKKLFSTITTTLWIKTEHKIIFCQ